MSQKNKIDAVEKSGFHPRNKHRFRYNFTELIASCPTLAKFVSINQYNNQSINFADAEAVKTLNKALLQHFYSIEYWDIPENYLCPPIPGRADYIHHIADLLASSNNNNLPSGKQIKILDIGIGANCIYPIIGVSEYNWNFIGTDIDDTALQSAVTIINKNSSLKGKVECRLQSNFNAIFKNIIQADEYFDISICNPPFHSSAVEAYAGTQRKWKNLGIKKGNRSLLNFGGTSTELWCKGGEEAFVSKMIEESAQFAKQCFWYSSIIAKSAHLPVIYQALNNAGARDIKTIEMSQGQKISRIVAWTFLSETEQANWRLKRWG